MVKHQLIFSCSFYYFLLVFNFLIISLCTIHDKTFGFYVYMFGAVCICKYFCNMIFFSKNKTIHNLNKHYKSVKNGTKFSFNKTPLNTRISSLLPRYQNSSMFQAVFPSRHTTSKRCCYNIVLTF